MTLSKAGNVTTEARSVTIARTSEEFPDNLLHRLALADYRDLPRKERPSGEHLQTKYRAAAVGVGIKGRFAAQKTEISATARC